MDGRLVRFGDRGSTPLASTPLIFKGLGLWDWSGKTNTKTQLKGICLSPRVSIPLVIDSFHTHSHVLGGVCFWGLGARCKKKYCRQEMPPPHTFIYPLATLMPRRARPADCRYFFFALA